MRERAPGVFAWQARIWNARPSNTGRRLEAGVPADWGPILDRVGTQQLPYLCASAEAWKAGARRHDAEIEGVRYRALPVSQYRVWRLERLRRHQDALPDVAKSTTRALLERHGCFEPLFRVVDPDSRYDDSAVPFRGRKVHYHNAQRQGVTVPTPRVGDPSRPRGAARQERAGPDSPLGRASGESGDS